MTSINREASIDIGDHQEWIALYSEMAMRDATLLDRMTQASSAFQNALSLTDNLSDISATEAFAISPDTLQHIHEAVAFAGFAKNRSFEAYEAVSQIYGETGFKEWQLGTDLEAIEPAFYVTRAIGASHPYIVKRHRQVRAEIEVFRQLHGVTDPNITLGTESLETPWAVSARMNAARNIQNLQLAQIVLSIDPTQTAKDFGKHEVLSAVGLPAGIDSTEIGQVVEGSIKRPWFDAAVALTRQIEPAENGLHIDA